MGISIVGACQNDNGRFADGCSFCNYYHCYGYCKHEDNHYNNEEYDCFWDDWLIAIPVPDLKFEIFVLSEIQVSQ
jgi:hypothetical protein